MEDKLVKRVIGMLSDGYVCNHCLGRSFAELLSGFSNKERGSIIRNFVAFLIDSGENIDVDSSNFHMIKFRNAKLKSKSPKKCKLCNNFFTESIESLANDIAKKMEKYESDTFLVGTILSSDIVRSEEKFWEENGIDFVEPTKSEINRELGKRIEKITGKKFDMSSPDITITVDLSKESITLKAKSLYIYGKYQKLARGIPQTKWLCRECRGKGCPRCDGEGKMYSTSVQEIIEKPLIKIAKAKTSKFHGSGREDIDARCLGKRPFVIEMLRPMVRKISLRSVASEINKSSKVKVSGLKLVDKDIVKSVKLARHDKTYVAVVKFEKDIDKKKVKLVKKLEGAVLKQHTPTRVVHRRTDMIRKRKIKKISAKVTGKKEIEFKITGEAGLYIKELISGDDGRTKPNVSDIIDNKVKSINLDVIKIHSS